MDLDKISKEIAHVDNEIKYIENILEESHFFDLLQNWLNKLSERYVAIIINKEENQNEDEQKYDELQSYKEFLQKNF